MFQSIKSRILALLIGMILLLAGVFGVSGYVLMVNSLKSSRCDYLRHITQSQAESLLLRIENKKSIITRIAKGEAVLKFTYNNEHQMLEEYFRKFADEFPGIAYVGIDGREQLKIVNQVPSDALGDISKTRLFKEMTWKRNSPFALLSISKTDAEETCIEFGICYQNYFDEFVGVIIARAPLETMIQQVSDYRFGQTGYLVLFDDRETLLFEPCSKSIQDKINIEGASLKEIIGQSQAGKTGFGRAVVQGTDGYYAFSPVQGTNWTVMAVLPYDEFIQAPNRLRNIILLLTSVVLVLGILISLVLAKKIAGPVHRLAQAAKRVAAGDFSQRVRIDLKDEIGVLGEAFNDMTGHLEKTTTTLDVLNGVNHELRRSQFEIEAANEKLVQSNQHLREFVHIASHDLKEPVRKISAFGQLLTRSLAGKLDDDEQENFDFMIDGANRMQQMVESLLAYSKVSTQRVEYETIDFNHIIHELETVELALPLEETGGIIVTPDALPVMDGHPAQIRQLMQNLIGNALKYRRKGVVPEVVIRAIFQGNDRVRVEVTDNGIGIKPEHYEAIFAMFRRLHSRQEYEGAGIGLALCKRIVENHGGEIGVRSTAGQGSTFWFTLPVLNMSNKEHVENANVHHTKELEV